MENVAVFTDSSQQPMEFILRIEIPELGIRKSVRVQLTDFIQDLVESLLRRLHLTSDQNADYRLFRPFNSASHQLNDDGSSVLEMNGTWMDNSCRLCDYDAWKTNDILVLINVKQPLPSLHHDSIVSAPSSPTKNSFLSAVTANKREQQHRLQLQQRLSSVDADQDLQRRAAGGPQRRRPLDSHSLDDILSGTKKMGTDTFHKLGKMAQKVMEPARSQSFRRQKSRNTTPHQSDGEGLMEYKLFGGPLESAPVDTKTHVPIVVEKLLTYIELNHLDMEGIFRLSGGASSIHALRDAFDKSTKGGADIRLDRLLPDGHTVASLVKLYLRELPEPLLTYKLYDCWIAAQLSPRPEVRVQYLHHLVRALPRANRRLLRRLCEFFNVLAHHGDVNKMTLQNIATVLGPNIARQQGQNASQVVTDAAAINNLAFELLTHQHEIFTSTSAFYRSHPELTETRYVCFARALYPYKPMYSNVLEDFDSEINLAELNFNTGDILFIQATGDINPQLGDSQESAGWWMAERLGPYKEGDMTQGIIPSNYVEVLWKSTSKEAHPELVNRGDSLAEIRRYSSCSGNAAEMMDASTQTDVVIIVSQSDWEKLCRENAELKTKMEEMSARLEKRAPRLSVSTVSSGAVDSKNAFVHRRLSAHETKLKSVQLPPPPQSPPSPPCIVDSDDAEASVPMQSLSLGTSLTLAKPVKTAPNKSFLMELQAKQLAKRASWAPCDQPPEIPAPPMSDHGLSSISENFVLSPDKIDLFLDVAPPEPIAPLEDQIIPMELPPVKPRADSALRFHFPPPPSVTPPQLLTADYQ